VYLLTFADETVRSLQINTASTPDTPFTSTVMAHRMSCTSQVT
jgi:hypothetical protein